MADRIKGPISSKLYGYEGLLAPLIAEACIDVLPANPANFNVDNVRVAKISGALRRAVLCSMMRFLFCSATLCHAVPVPCRAVLSCWAALHPAERPLASS